MTCTSCKNYDNDEEFKKEFEDESIVGFCYIPGSTIEPLYDLGQA